MFNPQQKEQFITQNYKNEDTQKSIRFLFDKTEKTEEYYNLDISKFDVKQLEDVLWSLDRATLESLEASYSYIRKYHLWSVKVGACPRSMTFSTITSNDMEFYLNDEAFRNQYIKSRSEMYEICDMLENDVDKVMIALIYEGVLGAGSEELLGLKKCKDNENSSYVDFNKRRFWINGEFSRYIESINLKTLAIIEDAIKQETYSNNNGQATGKNKEMDLIKSDYILRPVKIKKTLDNRPMTKSSIYTKFFKIQEWTEKYHLSAKNIHWSGMFDRLSKIEKSRELVSSDYKLILIDYGKNINLIEQLKRKYIKFKKILELTNL